MAALEFAMVFPIVMLLAFGVIQYGLRFWGMSTGAAAAREAARLMVVNTDWGCASAWARDAAGTAAFGPVTVTLTNLDKNTVVNTGTLIPEGTRIRVTVAFNSLDLKMGMVPNEQVVEHADALVQYEPTVWNGGSATPQPCPPEYS